MKFLTVVGARPQFIKAAPLSKALRRKHREILVHTGQHYDYDMSERFFKELKLPWPDYNLNIGSGRHGAKTAAILSRLEPLAIKLKPDAMIIFGDTNSTLAAALTAAKLHIPLAHIEAGMRSFNRQMPEEINRVVADHLADLHFCSTKTAVENLKNEGIKRNIFLVGDIMYDALKVTLPPYKTIRTILNEHNLTSGNYIFVTIHRAENTDNNKNLVNITNALIRSDKICVFPVHPRTEKMLKKTSIWNKLKNSPNIRLIPPQGYRDSLAFQSQAYAIITDSGGVQKEAYFLKIPCLTARTETEWVETIKTGWNHMVGPNKDNILKALATIKRPTTHPQLYGLGNTAESIVNRLERHLGR